MRRNVILCGECVLIICVLTHGVSKLDDAITLHFLAASLAPWNDPNEAQFVAKHQFVPNHQLTSSKCTSLVESSC